MRLGFNFREGPVIYQVAFDDPGSKRDVACRVSFAEIGGAIPGPRLRPLPADRVRHRRVGLGSMVTSLALGCDCLRGNCRCRRCCPTLVRAFRWDALSLRKGFVQTVANSH